VEVYFKDFIRTNIMV